MQRDLTLRFSMRLIVPLVVGTTIIALLFTFIEVKSEKRALRRDLEKRAAILAQGLSEDASPVLLHGTNEELQRLLTGFVKRQRIFGTAVLADGGMPLAMTAGMGEALPEFLPLIRRSLESNVVLSDFVQLGDIRLHVYVVPTRGEGGERRALALVNSADYIDSESSMHWRDTFIHILVQALLVAMISVLIIRASINQPLAKTIQWIREVRTGRARRRIEPPAEDVLKPLAQELASIARSLEVARSAAREEARLREAGASLWTAERLFARVSQDLRGKPFIVVSNREPLMHFRRGKAVEAIVPASGLVTALEPIIRACHGTWIAHGSGDADRLAVDKSNHLPIPLENPQYTLRRVWLNTEEEAGYYYGFSNEGLWPLFHIAHTRPTFREGDWRQYLAVNQKFASAVQEEIAGSEDPVVLIQDYHFALLPQLVKKQCPEARVAIFWHIPWPNPEAFRICPWQKELLEGMLGADLVGFHIQSHCNNFLDTVDAALECRIDREHFAVNRQGHTTLVRPFPISVAFTQDSSVPDSDDSVYLRRAALFKQLGVESAFLGVGVDRVDYTKGIIERFRGLERFIEKYPAYRQQFTFLQVGAPSRTNIKRYQDLLQEVDAEAARINSRFQTHSWRPIVLLKRQFSHAEIDLLYKIADLCLVTSLHDGMNLVAKEFVAARDDEDGVLILSCFTGASRELHDAVIINPYDTEQLADSIHVALVMDPEERRMKMRRMRRVIREHNVFRWAGELITELAKIRLEKTEVAGAP